MDAVGSNIRVDTYNWEVKRILPRLNNEINEEWISDKTRYSCDGLLKQRLDVPYIKKENKLQKSSWDEAIEIIVNMLIFAATMAFRILTPESGPDIFGSICNSNS